MSLVDLYLDPATGDLDLTNSRVRLTQNIEEAVRQKLEITLRTFRGELFSNINFGVPYLENEDNPVQLFGEASQIVFDTEIKSQILSVEGVVDILSYNSFLSPIDGILDINFKATTESGEVISPVEPISLQII